MSYLALPVNGCSVSGSVMFQTLFLFAGFHKDPGLRDLSAATGFASLRCEEKAGGAQQRGRT